MKDALAYAQKPGGIWKTADYGYTSSDGEVDECETLTKPYALTVGGIFELNTDDIATNTERLMVQRLSNTGTLSVCLDATIWSTYVSGTIYNCDNNQINHCAHVVGVYFSSAENSGFYKIRNHWGTDWGIDGYVSVAYGSDVCGVASTPMYTDTTQDRRRSLRQ
jgi:C1A family cysteine protease